MNIFGQSLAGQIKKVVFDKFGENVTDEPEPVKPTPRTPIHSEESIPISQKEVDLSALLAEENYEELFKHLKTKIADDSSLQNELVQLQARYNRLRRQTSQGIITSADAEMRMNQINQAAQYLISRLP